MGIFDRVFGRNESKPASAGAPSFGQTSDDEAAIARYRYLIKTAPPEALEQAHAEAFARLTPQQRRTVLDQLAADLPEPERAAAQRAGDSPGALARVATRAEIRQPGAMERAYGRIGASPGFGSMLAGSFLASMAGAVLGTAIARNLFEGGGLESGSTDAGSAGGDASADAGSDGGGDFGGGDFGGGFDV